MRFKIEDREYEYDATLTVEEAMFLQDKTGLGMNECDAAITKGNPYAIAAWMMILMKRAGVVVRWQDMLKLDIRTFRIIRDDPDDPDEDNAESDGNQQGEGEPDPTQPDGTTPESATSST